MRAAAYGVTAQPLFSPGDGVGDYVIDQRLGAGGFGEVYLATERSLSRQVALKFVLPEHAAKPVFAERFQREAEAMAAVVHPNVVPIHRFGDVGGLRYVAMRYVPGGSLDAVLLDRAPALADVVEVLAGVAAGLDACHARGVVHRDLKPANVLIDAAEGVGLLADFGVALTDEAATLTAPGSLVGTIAYMAPELLMGRRATPASDLWALGAIAYRVATGRLPRGVSQPHDTVPVAPSVLNERLRPDVDPVLMRALSFDPSDRYPDAGAFVADLRDALEGPSHRPIATAPPARGKGRRRRVLGGVGAALVLVPAATFGVLALNGPTCHPSYSGACLEPDIGDYDCRGGSGDGPNFVSGPIQVVGRDDFRLDADGDGVAC